MRCGVFLLLFATSLAYAQAPQITPGGVVSAASWSSPIAPGELIAIFGTGFGSTQGGSTVTVNGVNAPVLFTSPTQINAVVPASLMTGAVPSLTAAVVVVTTPAGSSIGEVAALARGAPGFFTADSSGCGQVSALNVTPDGTVSVNSPANSAAPGDSVALFGTGFGLAAQPAPVFLIDNDPVSSFSYAGPAPGLAGVDQINLQLPPTTRSGCNVPVSAEGFWSGPTVTLSVQAGRGKCVDPPVLSYGTISLTKSGTTEFFSASFPAGPGVVAPAPEPVVFAPNWAVSAGSGEVFSILSPAPVYPRSCTVPGYAQLSAGAIQVQPPSGSPATVAPTSGSYGGLLPAGFIGPGTYTFTGTPGGDVTLGASLNVGSPIQLQTTFAPGTTIAQGQPLTVKWTGGDAGSLVRVALTSGGLSDYSYAAATAGSITIAPQSGLPLSTSAQITVTVLPAQATIVSTPGITGSVQLTWSYLYGFSGLTLTN